MSNPDRIGVFGGTFDPIHNTHLDIARAALEHARLDRVVFVVSARPPHKKHGPFADAESRYNMVKAALEEEPLMEASRIELDRTGLSYTVDTLAEFQRAYPSSELFLIIGYDALADLPSWRSPETIVACARLLVVRRPGLCEPIPNQFASRSAFLPFDETGLSSTEVRRRIQAGEPFEELVPFCVARFIDEHGLYRN